MTPDELASIPPARLPFPVTRAQASAIETQAEPDAMPTMVGRFSTFGDWYEVDSMLEGHFLERVGERAFEKTISESRSQMKVLYDHGQDPQIGNKILGPIEDLRSDASYKVPLFDTSYNRDLRPGLEAGVYGSSFRFTVEKDQWDQSPTRADHNPMGLPERTITEARVYEFGPVTFPANPNATAGVRSTTDAYYKRSRDPEQFETLMRSAQAARTPNRIGVAAAPVEPPITTPEPEPVRSDTQASDPPKQPPIAAQPINPDPPKGGSSDSRENPSVEYITREDKASRVTELEQAIARRADEYPGVFPEDVQKLDDAEFAERNALAADIRAVDERRARVAAFASAAIPGTVAPTAPNIRKQAEDIYDLAKLRTDTRSREDFDTRVRENALRSIESQRSAKDLNHLVDLVENNDDTGELAHRVLATGSPAYRRAFAKYLRRGNTDGLTTEERAAIAVVGTTTTGGYAVPYIFDPTMYHTGVWTAENPFRKACRTVEITGGNNWRTVTVGAITSAYATEAGAASENAPSFGQPTYTVVRAQAFATLSIETLEDRSDITQELTSVFAESKDTLEENKFAVGAGTTVPLGMFTNAAYTNVDSATNDVTAILDLQVLEGALPLRYRANAAFFMNRSTLRQLLALDTTYRYFSGAGIQFPGNPQPTQLGSNGGGNTGYSLLGYPVWEVPSAVSTLTTDGAIIVVFADPKSYIIVDRVGMNVEVVPTMLNGATPSFPTGERGIYVYWRNYAAPIAADAGRSLSVQ